MSDGFYSTDWDNQDGSQGYTNQAFDQNAYSANAYDNSYDQSQSYNPNMYNGDMYTPGKPNFKLTSTSPRLNLNLTRSLILNQFIYEYNDIKLI